MTDHSLGDADFYDPNDYVGIGKRIVVMVIDMLVILILSLAIWIPYSALYVWGMIQDQMLGCFWLLHFFVIWVYLAPIKRSEFGTLGYWLMSIRIVTTKGGRPTLLSMTGRMLMWTLGPFNLVTDLLWLGADTENQSLRDCYLSTYLVAKNAVPVGRAPVHLTRYNAMGFTLAYPRVCRPK